jgi:hypothetical protein
VAWRRGNGKVESLAAPALMRGIYRRLYDESSLLYFYIVRSS